MTFSVIEQRNENIDNKRPIFKENSCISGIFDTLNNSENGIGQLLLHYKSIGEIIS
jgi:hypothetical protein